MEQEKKTSTCPWIAKLTNSVRNHITMFYSRLKDIKTATHRIQSKLIHAKIVAVTAEDHRTAGF